MEYQGIEYYYNKIMNIWLPKYDEYMEDSFNWIAFPQISYEISYKVSDIFCSPPIFKSNLVDELLKDNGVEVRERSCEIVDKYFKDNNLKVKESK